MHNRWVRILALVLGLYVGMRYLFVPLLPFAMALSAAVLLEPWILWCRRRLGFQRKFAAAAVVTLLLAAVAGLLGGLLGKLWSESAAWLERLPETLGDAIEAFEGDPFMKKVLGDHIYTKYLEAKKKEWRAFRAQVTDWEISQYLYKY